MIIFAMRCGLLAIPTLPAMLTAYVVRGARSSMPGVLAEDTIRNARAKGGQMASLHRGP